MNNGIYTAYSGLRAQMDALDVLANNLANLNTAGFKEEMIYFSLQNPAAESATNSSDLGSTINRSIKTQGALSALDGSINQTNRDLDVAIEGNGFLTLQTPRGIRYTRNGNLQLNSKGLLVASDGSPLLGTSGRPIALGPGKIAISEQGAVSLDGSEVDRLKIVAFDDLSNLAREGNSLLMLQNGKGEEKISNARIKSGYLEQSNINAINSIVRMVDIMRQFEAIKKTIDLVMNDINTKSIDKLGK